MNDLKRTALFDEHRAAGARLVPFAGWEMPVQYAGVIEEVRAVRENCGIFDVSHMGQFDVNTPDAAASGATSDVAPELNRVISADWTKVPLRRVGYSLLLNENGGVLDDIMGYHVGLNEWLIVANASRAAVDEAHLKRYLPQLPITNRYENQAMLAIQGPRAAAVLGPLTEDADLSQMQWRDCAAARVAGAPGLLARGGYTGSDGFEFMFRADDAPRVWRALLQAGAVPCGLGARDVLRLEAGLPLYGHELREEWTPFESGCGWAVKFDKGDFVGRTAVLEKREPEQRIQALKMESRALAREGYAVRHNGETVGEVTSGTLSPTVGSGIALAMLPASLQPGDGVEVLIRNTSHPARIVTKPFVAPVKK